MSRRLLWIWTDGSSRGTTAGIGYRMQAVGGWRDPEEEEFGVALRGQVTSTEAEFLAAVAAVRHGASWGATDVVLWTDALQIVHTLDGEEAHRSGRLDLLSNLLLLELHALRGRLEARWTAKRPNRAHALALAMARAPAADRQSFAEVLARHVRAEDQVAAQQRGLDRAIAQRNEARKVARALIARVAAPERAGWERKFTWLAAANGAQLKTNIDSGEAASAENAEFRRDNGKTIF